MPTTAVGIYGIKGKDAGGGDRTVFSHPVFRQGNCCHNRRCDVCSISPRSVAAPHIFFFAVFSTSVEIPADLFPLPSSLFFQHPGGKGRKRGGQRAVNHWNTLKPIFFFPQRVFPERERDRKIEVKSPRFSVTAAFCVHSSSFVHMRYFVQKRTTRVSQVTRSALMEALRLFPYFSPSPIS